MSTSEIFLKDYQAPQFSISKLDLNFEIFADKVLVRNSMQITSNDSLESLVLFGENQTLLNVSIDKKKLDKSDYSITDKELCIKLPTDKSQYQIEILSEVDPYNNTALEGLYKSGDILCTQNEPEGFRKITFFPDRPDVMTIFTTRIEADKKTFPVLLANGNCVAKGELSDDRHYAVWEDPFPKPAYLFALVAGELACVSDSFTTQSGREIALEIFVDPGNEDKAPFALESLKKAMKWDEDTFGLEYDLDIYMIVAVDAFNMGAMENKGLNIFNSSCALANPATATDLNFMRVEAVIAHEYFHNWTGNRVTCRDWFQLTLKEGLTVFRDQSFSADMHSASVKRIEDVCDLRNYQFVEDASPNAHPIQPQSYIEINNFYTPTVYEKGSEIIRMIHSLLGKENFRKGMDLYFERHDGQAVTTQDFVAAMQDASGVNLNQFSRWYTQVGTPGLKVNESYDAEEKTYRLDFEQVLATEQDALHMPIKMALLDDKGNELRSEQLELNSIKQNFTFTNFATKPRLSLLREFSAPVQIDFEYSDEDLSFLFAHDKDDFCRYEAGQNLALREINSQITALQKGLSSEINPDCPTAFSKFFNDANLDESFRSLGMSLPSLISILERCEDGFLIDEAYQARKSLKQSIILACEDGLLAKYTALHTSKDYKFSTQDAAERSIKNLALSYLCSLQKPEYLELAKEQYRNAKNMTDQFAALASLVNYAGADADEFLESFYQDWQNDSLVMNKWLAVQVSADLPNRLETIAQLEKSPAFDSQNPNKIRSLYGAFLGNLAQFHAADGSGYQFLADKVIAVNAINPQIAAGLAKQFKKYPALDAARKAKMKLELERILAEGDKLSGDVFEIISKTLG